MAALICYRSDRLFWDTLDVECSSLPWLIYVAAVYFLLEPLCLLSIAYAKGRTCRTLRSSQSLSCHLQVGLCVMTYHKNDHNK